MYPKEQVCSESILTETRKAENLAVLALIHHCVFVSTATLGVESRVLYHQHQFPMYV